MRLRSTQFVLLALVGVEDSVGLSELAQLADLDRSTVTRNLRPLEREGWIRIRSEGAGRPSHARLTPKGKRVLTRAVPLWDAAQKAFTRELGRGVWKELLPQLAHVRTVATALEQGED